MSTAVACVLFGGVLIYSIFGGADFGAGIWDLVAGGAERGERPRSVIDHSIGPVWEANHVWLIFVLVVAWTAFPVAFGSVASTLYIPLFIAAFGEAGVLPAIIATVINSSLVVACAVAAAELAQSAGRRIGHVVADVAVALATNPLVVAPIAGVVISVLGLALPRPVVTLAELLGASASPGALFAIGLFLVGRPLASGTGELA